MPERQRLVLGGLVLLSATIAQQRFTPRGAFLQSFSDLPLHPALVPESSSTTAGAK